MPLTPAELFSLVPMRSACSLESQHGLDIEEQNTLYPRGALEHRWVAGAPHPTLYGSGTGPGTCLNDLHSEADLTGKQYYFNQISAPGNAA